MTITARHAARRLHAANLLMTKVTANLPTAIAAIHTHIDTGNQHDDRPQREDAGIRSIGGHTDPTADAAIARTTAYERHLEDVEQHLATLVLSLGLLVDHCNRWVMTPANAEDHPRCSGGGGVEEWADPTCTAYVMSTTRIDGTNSYNRDGLCVACYQRRRRWQKSNDAA